MTMSSGAPVTDEMLEAAMLWRQRLDSGEWSVDDEANFEVWLQADERHALAYEEIRELCGFIDKHAASPELIGARKDVLASVHRRARLRWTGPAMVLRVPTRRAIAAVLVAGVVGSAGAWALVGRGDGNPRLDLTGVRVEDLAETAGSAGDRMAADEMIYGPHGGLLGRVVRSSV